MTTFEDNNSESYQIYKDNFQAKNYNACISAVENREFKVDKYLLGEAWRNRIIPLCLAIIENDPNTIEIDLYKEMRHSGEVGLCEDVLAIKNASKNKKGDKTDLTPWFLEFYNKAFQNKELHKCTREVLQEPLICTEENYEMALKRGWEWLRVCGAMIESNPLLASRARYQETFAKGWGAWLCKKMVESSEDLATIANYNNAFNRGGEWGVVCEAIVKKNKNIITKERYLQAKGLWWSCDLIDTFLNLSPKLLISN